MKIAMTEKESDLIKMENGKKDLPKGITRTGSKGHHIRRKVLGKTYSFPVIHNQELAIAVNEKVREMAEDFQIHRDEQNAAHKKELLDAKENNDFIKQNEELVRELSAISYNVKSLFYIVSELHDKQNKSFFKRIFNL